VEDAPDITIGDSPPALGDPGTTLLEPIVAAAFANPGEWVSVTTPPKYQAAHVYSAIAAKVAEAHTRQGVLFIRVYPREEV
jgi:hypothetical protein